MLRKCLPVNFNWPVRSLTRVAAAAVVAAKNVERGLIEIVIQSTETSGKFVRIWCVLCCASMESHLRCFCVRFEYVLSVLNRRIGNSVKNNVNETKLCSRPMLTEAQTFGLNSISHDRSAILGVCAL